MKLALETGMLSLALTSICTIGQAKINQASIVDKDNNKIVDEKSNQTVLEKRNVVFIICDDLRTELGCYGNPQIQSPNIDNLASDGILFSNAYCNIPVSGASRASLLTGYRPRVNAISAWNARVDSDVPFATPINQCFQNEGYTTIANGKIFHHDDELAARFWDKDRPFRNFLSYKDGENQRLTKIKQETGKGKRGSFFEAMDVDDSNYVDYQIADQSIKDIKELSKGDKPFFLAVGFIRPHLPFIVPKKYWDKYNHEEIQIPDNFILKEGNDIPVQALTNYSELRQYTGIPKKGKLSEQEAKNMIHGYYAGVSFVDAQIGRVIQALKDEGIYENTSIVLIGDHGWNLGEHGIWCKHCVMKTSLYAPMIIKPANSEVQARNRISKSRKDENGRNFAKKSCYNDVVEFVDIYPTLCELGNIEGPEYLEGSSLVPIVAKKVPTNIMSRKQARKALKKENHKDYAICRWANGFTYIDKDFSYTEWWSRKDGSVQNRLLFDLRKDPEENYNVVNDSRYKQKVKEFSKILKQEVKLNFSEELNSQKK